MSSEIQTSSMLLNEKRANAVHAGTMCIA